MNRSTRTIALQLTPLLDLLLIVIFAQYMEMAEADRVRAAATASQHQALETAQQDRDRIQAALSEALRLISEAESAMQSSQARLASQQRELHERERAFSESQARQQALGKLIVELFRIPQPIVDEVLDPNRSPPASESNAELARLREEFRRLTEASPGRIVKHLLTFDEVRKRCDFWELHLQANPRRLLLLDAQRQPHSLTPPLVDEQPGAALNQPAFERELYALWKSWPQPKSLVIVTLTYDADVRINVRDPLHEGILHVLQRLRSESLGESRFELADLGIPVGGEW